MKKISLIGAGGHSRSVMALLSQFGFEIESLFDDGFQERELILGIPLIGQCNLITRTHKLVLAVGDNDSRRKYYLQYISQIVKENIIHPTAVLEKRIILGEANNIFAQAYLNNEVTLGDNNIINTRAIIEHEVNIGSHNHISVGATLLGRSQIGDGCFIGAGAIVRDKVKIGNGVVVGANSFVAKDITSPGIYVGSPARKVK